MSNVIDLDPMPTALVGKISREAWHATSSEVRSETVRAWQELLAGIAIAKDRRCGRLKSHRQPGSGVSFHALHLLEMDIWRRPDDAAKVASAEVLREQLAPDEAWLHEQDETFALFESAQAAGIGRGMTLPQYMHSRIALENAIRRDHVSGLARALLMVGIAPVELAKKIFANDQQKTGT